MKMPTLPDSDAIQQVMQLLAGCSIAKHSFVMPFVEIQANMSPK
jgi:hypothetical protein